MKKYEKMVINKEENVHVGSACNKCGQFMRTEGTTENSFAHNLMHDMIASFGYGSNFDTETWYFDLCEPCLTEFVKSFTIMPEGFAYGAKHPEKVFDTWKETGDVNFFSGWSKEEIDEYNTRQEESEKWLKQIDLSNLINNL